MKQRGSLELGIISGALLAVQLASRGAGEGRRRSQVDAAMQGCVARLVAFAILRALSISFRTIKLYHHHPLCRRP